MPDETPVERPVFSFDLLLTIFGFGVVSLLGWMRFGNALWLADVLGEYQAAASPLYLALGGAAWGLMALFAALWLVLRRRSAPLVAGLAATAMVAWYWIDRLLLTQSEAANANTWFAIGASLVGLLFAWVAPHLQKGWGREEITTKQQRDEGTQRKLR